MRVLVRGGAGYIGSHTCKALALAGHIPIAYDNLRAGHRWATKLGPLELGDINDAATLNEVIRCHKPNAVITFATLAYVGESNSEPTLHYRNNVAGMVTLLETMRCNDVCSIVSSSGCAAYGMPTRLPIIGGPTARASQSLWPPQTHGRDDPARRLCSAR